MPFDVGGQHRDGDRLLGSDGVLDDAARRGGAVSDAPLIADGPAVDQPVAEAADGAHQRLRPVPGQRVRGEGDPRGHRGHHRLHQHRHLERCRARDGVDAAAGLIRRDPGRACGGTAASDRVDHLVGGNVEERLVLARVRRTGQILSRRRRPHRKKPRAAEVRRLQGGGNLRGHPVGRSSPRP